MSIEHFLMPTKNKIVLMFSFVIISLISSIYYSAVFVYYLIAFYLLSCAVIRLTEFLIAGEKNVFSKSTMRYLKAGSLSIGFASMVFGFIFLDFTALSYLQSMRIDFFNFVTGFLLTLLGVVLMLLYIVTSKIEKSVIIRFITIRRKGNPERVTSLVSTWAFALSISLFFYSYLGLTSFYTIILSVIIVLFLWLTLKSEI